MSVSVPSVTPLPHEMHTLLKQLLLIQSVACVQGKRSAQRGQRSPPQSVEVSLPFCTPSVQVPGSAQRPAWQRPLWHWASAVQTSASAHSPQAALPQSVTGSPPLATPSLQLGAWQQRCTPGPQPAPPHTLLWQSSLPLQLTPVAQLGQGPPQSTPDSGPLRTPSLHVRGWQQRALPGAQARARHTPFRQSLAALQLLPVPQAAQSPPQSSSASLPLATSSLQLGTAQRPSLPHTWLRQSASALQVLPSAQPGHAPPPQSVCSSVPLRAPSLQEGGLQRPLALRHDRPVLQSPSP
jgi:hypothetical protein